MRQRSNYPVVVELRCGASTPTAGSPKRTCGRLAREAVVKTPTGLSIVADGGLALRDFETTAADETFIVWCPRVDVDPGDFHGMTRVSRSELERGIAEFRRTGRPAVVMFEPTWPPQQ